MLNGRYNGNVDNDPCHERYCIWISDPDYVLRPHRKVSVACQCFCMSHYYCALVHTHRIMVLYWLHKLIGWVVLWFLLVWSAAALGPDSGVEQMQQWTEFQLWNPAQKAGPQDFSSLWVSAAPSLRHKVPGLCLPTLCLTGDVSSCSPRSSLWTLWGDI